MTKTTQMLLGTAAMTLALAFGAQAQDVARENTVIFDLDRTIADPENFNWMTDGTGIRRMHGAHQAMWEPLFILNYNTGALEGWLGTEAVSDDDGDVWTISLREGVTWSDGEAFNADDVVFTVNMALENEELTAREVATLRGQVASVEKIDDLTVHVERAKPPLCRGKFRRADFWQFPDHARTCVGGGGRSGDVYLFPANWHGPLCVSEQRVEPGDLGPGRDVVGRRDGLHGHARAGAGDFP